MQDPLDQLAEEFTERHRRGERPTVDEYIARHPDLADQIRDLFATIRLIEDHGSVEGDCAGLPGRTGVESVDGLPRIGDYRIIRTIGHGGMGVVYEAEQMSLRRRVALKVLPARSRLNPSHLRRFQLEARSAAQLQHPSIVPVYEVDEVDGLHFYAMQFIPGQGLDEVIDELRRLRSVPVKSPPDLSTSVAGSLLGGRIDDDDDDDDDVEKREPAEGSSSTVHLPGKRSSSSSSSNALTPYFRSVAAIGVQVAGALAYAHERGILHRDVKPSNLLLDLKSHVWITDFGLAKSEDSEGLTRTGDIVGTLRYMGPERFNGWSDPTSDVYSLGATLYELLTLRPAFDGADRASLVRQIVNDTPTPPRRLDSRIPRDLETIVLKAMEKQPRHRYQSAEQLAADLGRFLEDRPIVARRNSAAERAWLWCRRNPGVATLGGLIAALLIAVAIGASMMAYDSRQKLRRSYFEQARARRWSGHAGQRYESLRAIREAVSIAPGLDLRNEAIAALALDDIDRVGLWELPRGDEVKGKNLEVDGKLERFFVGNESGTIEVYRVGERRPLFELQSQSPAARISGLHLGPEGRLLVAVHAGELALWDLEERRELWRHVERSIWSADVDFSRDGSLIATGGSDGSVIALETRSGRVLERFSTGRDVLHTRFSPDGRTLAVCRAGSRSVELRDIGGTATSRSLDHDRAVYGLAWSAGDVLAVGCEDSHIYLWDPGSATRLRRLEGHDGEPVHLVFSPAGDLLASSGWDGLTCLWDPRSVRPLLRHEGQCLRFSDDGRFLAFADRKLGEIFEIAPREVYRPLHGHTGGDLGVTFSPDGRWLATSGEKDGIRLRDLTTAREVAHFPADSIRWIRFHPGGSSFLTGGDHGLYRWPFREERGARGTSVIIGPPEALWKGARLRAVDLATGTDTLVAIHNENQTHPHTLAVSSPAQGVSHDGHARLASCAISPDGTWIAAGTYHGDGVPVWRVGEKRKERVLPVAWTSTVAFSPDGRWLVTSNSEEYRFWSTQNWEPGIRLPRHRPGDAAGVMSFSPDGSIFAMTWTRSVIRLIDPGSGDQVATLEAPRGYHVGSMTFNRDGTLLAAAMPNQLVHLWDLRALRKRLAEIGLDWELPALPPATPLEGTTDAVEVAVDLGRLDPRVRFLRDRIDQMTARIRKDPRDHEAYVSRAWSRLDTGETREAIEDCDRALELAPHETRAREVRSLAFEALGEWEDAIAEREKVLASRPDDPVAMNNLAWLCISAPEPHRRPQRALELASRAVEREPHENSSLNTLGVVHYRLGQFEKAGDVLRRALFADGGPTMFDQIFLAMTAARLGDRTAAKKHHDAAIRLLDEKSARAQLTPDQRREMERFQAEARELLGPE